MKTLFLISVLCCSAAAGEIAVLRNGFVMRAERIERSGGRVRLYMTSGVVEFNEDQIASIEPEASVPPAPPVVPPEAPAAVAVPKPKTASELLIAFAGKYNLPPEFVRSVALVESAARQDAVSPKGAIGVMQLMPGTAQSLGADPHDMEQNIEAGTRHLRDLLEKYQNDPNPVRRALAAYNAGSGAVDKYNGVPPYRETQSYVEKVIDRYWKQVGGAPAPH